jgi:hypothetical protein
MRKNTVPQIKKVLQGAEFDFVEDYLSYGFKSQN